MRKIGIKEIEDIALGAALLGAGGGGDPYVGKLVAMGAVKECGEVTLLDPDEIPDDALVVPIAMMGAPTVLAEKGIALEDGEDTVGYIAEKGFSEKYGARNLRRLIQTELEDPIASKIIASYRNGVTKVRARVSDGKEVIETE